MCRQGSSGARIPFNSISARRLEVQTVPATGACPCCFSLTRVNSHPEHLEIAGGHVQFQGPSVRPARAAWEHIKSAIRVAACPHEIASGEYLRTGRPEVLADLKAIEKHRRLPLSPGPSNGIKAEQARTQQASIQDSPYRRLTWLPASIHRCGNSCLQVGFALIEDCEASFWSGRCCKDSTGANKRGAGSLQPPPR